MVLEWFRRVLLSFFFGSGFDMLRHGLPLLVVWLRSVFGVVLVKLWYGVGLVWLWYGLNTVVVRFWCGYRMVLV